VWFFIFTPMNVRIGGVPEHFNLPWLLAIEKGLFQQKGIQVEWQFFPGGSGAMHNALKYDQIDLAILLTEGFVAAVSKGLQAKIIKTYIDSPLRWGIYTGAQSEIASFHRAHDDTFAISRPGSGSHLMPLIHAQQEGIAIHDNQFVIVDDLKHAVVSLNRSESRYFYWEKYTTLPLVKSALLRQVGEFSAPWSSFIIAGNPDFVNRNQADIKIMFAIIDDITLKAAGDISFKKEVETRFKLTAAETEEWIAGVQWNQGIKLTDQSLRDAINSLKQTGILTRQLNTESLLLSL